MLPASGTIVPLVTPFDAEDRVDAAALNRLVAFIVQEGADALMPTALTGEGPLLTADETIAVWEATFAANRNGLPVVPAVITTTTREAVRLARRAHALGAAGLMVAPIVPGVVRGTLAYRRPALLRGGRRCLAARAGGVQLPVADRRGSHTRVPRRAGRHRTPAIREGKHQRQPARPRHPSPLRGSADGDLWEPQRGVRIDCARLPAVDHRDHECRARRSEADCSTFSATGAISPPRARSTTARSSRWWI